MAIRVIRKRHKASRASAMEAQADAAGARGRSERVAKPPARNKPIAKAQAYPDKHRPRASNQRVVRNRVKPREDSKQGQLIELLSHNVGMDISGIAATLGWQAHTVRAALTRLRQKGYRIERTPALKSRYPSSYRIVQGQALAAPAVKPCSPDPQTGISKNGDARHDGRATANGAVGSDTRDRMKGAQFRVGCNASVSASKMDQSRRSRRNITGAGI